MSDIEEALNRALFEAKATYKGAAKNPLDHGFAMIKGVDGRTKLAREASTVDGIEIQRDDYHGTTLHLEGVNRYLTPQRAAYDVFIKQLQAEGIDVGEMHVWAVGH